MTDDVTKSRPLPSHFTRCYANKTLQSDWLALVSGLFFSSQQIFNKNGMYPTIYKFFTFFSIAQEVVSTNLTNCYLLNKATAAMVISRLRINNNGELKKIYGLCSKITPLDIEEGVKGKSQQLEKNFRP